MSNFDNIPEWILKLEPQPSGETEIWSLSKVSNIVAELNFLKGSYAGYAMRIDELEEKFAMALEYQRELDAQLLDKRGHTEAARLLREEN